MQADIQSFRAAIETLQALAVLIGVFAVLGPVVMAALFWYMRRSFPTRDEFNGQGSRITAYETMTITNRERADHAHERMDKHEAWIGTELKYIRRDLDQLLHKGAL